MQGPDADQDHDEVVGLAPFVAMPVWLAELGPYPVVVYFALGTFADNVTKTGWPSVESIAQRAHLSETCTRGALKALVAAGAITVTKRKRRDGGSFVNLYNIMPAVTGGGAPHAPPRVREAQGEGAPHAPELNSLELSGEEEGLDPPLGDVLPAAPVLLRASAGAREAPRLCDELRSAIIANGGRSYPVTKAWLDAARLLIDRDGVDPSDVSHAIQWSTSHSFWAANILSMPKLREKYDTLRLQAQRDGNGTGTARQREYDDAMRSLDRMIQEAPA